ncbi:37S ribosomal protein S18 [Aspergillus sclerotiicarbonarius CBS 121057]|uniref:Small ribosomal subunit protein bS18m n=1 Tax=Aspergillus sclerotiicarbonarius (strain CBS 121057 / IBT 28362) TaxID=1448318 RepID=A0A319DTK8_ASPSB|nr:37S ribosomal protein S18 [Aspergillus sclerotiicarbonarius CBS 121057]
MALHLFSWSPLRTVGSTLGSVSAVATAACRWNSTAAPNAAPRAPRPQAPRVFNRRRPNRQRFLEDQRAQNESRALERFQTREWRAGDIYSPHDLSPTEMRKWRKRNSPPTDAFDALNVNPLHMYKNFSIMSEYVTSMGRIKGRNLTGLRPVNQRKISKAIRRAIGLGLMPSVHRHPEILAAEAKARMEGGSGF